MDEALKSNPADDIKLIFPVPDVGLRPIAGLLLVQLNMAPAVPEKLTLTGCPEQTLTLAGAVIVGVAFTVSTTGVRVVLIHPVDGSRVSA